MRSPRALITHVLLSCSLCACSLNNLGDPPPEADIYLPTGLALSAQASDSPPRLLYVINSNFDLRYNAGSLQAYDLDALDAAINGCPKLGYKCSIDPKTVIADEVLVPSLATSIGFSADHGRMYVATRTDPSLSFIDLDETAAANQDVLSCDETERRCSNNHRRGDVPNQNPRRLTLPAEPVGLISMPVASLYTDGSASEDGNFVLVAHRAGQVSLFFDDGKHSENPSDGPELIDVRGNLPLELTGIVFDPMTRLSYLSVYARGTTLTDVKLLSRLGIAAEADPRSAFLYNAGSLSIDGVSVSTDTRAVTLNPSRPGEALVVSHDPAALLWVDVAGSLEGRLPAGSAPARRIVKVGDGPSRVALGEVSGRSIAAVSCFDAQEVSIVDTDTAEVLAIVHNLNGPFELAIDSARRRLYVADFRSSVVRVMNLAPVVDGANGERTDVAVIATLGIPKAVMELQ